MKACTNFDALPFTGVSKSYFSGVDETLDFISGERPKQALSSEKIGILLDVLRHAALHVRERQSTS